MKTPNWKAIAIIGCLLGSPHAFAEPQPPLANPFADGITPIQYSQSEREELELYFNKQETRLKRMLLLAQSTYPKKKDCDIDKRIEMYLEDIRKIVPDSALDLTNITATILRISLNQGVYLEEKMRGVSYFTHAFREKVMLWSINTAMDFYQTDVELFQSKKRLEDEYLAYAMAFAKMVDNYYDELSKREAVEFYHDSAQLLLNVLQAKGNIVQNNYVDEMHDLADIREKTDPGFQGVPSTRKERVKYARTAFRNVAQSIAKKFTAYLQGKAKHEQEQAISAATTIEQIFFIERAQYGSAILAEHFKVVRTVPEVYQEISFTYYTVSGGADKPFHGRMFCSLEPAIRSGIYLEGQKNPWPNFLESDGCAVIFKGKPLEFPYGDNDSFVLQEGRDGVSFNPITLAH